MQKDKLLYLSIHCLVSLVAAFIFLSRWFFVLAVGLVSWKLYAKEWKEKKRQALLERERIEFRYFLEIFSARLEAGENTTQAMAFTLGQLQTLFPMGDQKASSFLRALEAFVKGQESSLSLRRGLEKLAGSFQEELAASFFSRLPPAMDQGADLCKLSRSYLRLLVEDQRLRADRKSSMEPAKREQKILFAMPLVLLLAMRFTGMVGTDYRLMDYLARILSGGLFFLAWKWSRSLLKG